MNIEKIKDGKELTVHINESLTAINSVELENILLDDIADVDTLILDLSDMEYTSSAGLRCFVKVQQTMDRKNADMIIRGASEFVMEIFEETGFNRLLHIEEAHGKLPPVR